jgi:predicted nucleic acid-binding protein
MFLIDTNCWMAIARGRGQAGDVTRFLTEVPAADLHTSIYTVHSLGLLFQRHKMHGQYAPFLELLGIGSRVGVVEVPLRQLGRIDAACTRHRLDFDDAYQYVVAELHDLKIVSLDADFDRTPRGRLEPLAALAHYIALREEQQHP